MDLFFISEEKTEKSVRPSLSPLPGIPTDARLYTNSFREVDSLPS